MLRAYNYNNKDIDIVVSLRGGLGNRLTSLFSSYYLSITYNLPIKYLWHKDMECKFEDIFECNKIKLVDNSDLEDRIIISDCINKKQLKNKIFWKTFECVFCEIPMGLSLLPINKNIENIINLTSIEKRTLGVHVRGGDIKKEQNEPQDKRKYVPPEKFLPFIDKLLINHDKIFLSCEDKEDEIIFFEEYKNKIIKLEDTVYGRDTLEGILCGFVNMMLLSKCSMIIGMHSSFSSLAAQLGKIKKIII